MIQCRPEGIQQQRHSKEIKCRQTGIEKTKPSVILDAGLHGKPKSLQLLNVIGKLAQSLHLRAVYKLNYIYFTIKYMEVKTLKIPFIIATRCIKGLRESKMFKIFVEEIRKIY